MRCKLLFAMFVCSFVVSLGYGDVGDMISPSQLVATASSGNKTTAYADPMMVVDGTGMTGDSHTWNGGTWFTDATELDRWIVVDLGGTYHVGEV